MEKLEIITKETIKNFFYKNRKGMWDILVK